MKILFSGRVQGVGFRYTVCCLSEGFGVVGFVKNLPDGDVELVAEGAQDALSGFAAAIRDSRLKSYILQERMTWEPPAGTFRQFGVSIE